MFVTTLLTAPDGPPLDPALVRSLCGAWGGRKVTWLSAHEAAEFAMPARPDNFEDVWQEMQRLAVDLVVQPSAGRRKNMLLADMDSTMIRQECIDELADQAGIGSKVAAITARAMNGELAFEDSLRERVALLRGLDQTVIETVLANRITLMPGAAPLLATMKAEGAYAALVSGGFTAFTQKVARTLGFDENRANSLCVLGGKLTGEVVEPILGRDAKVQALQDITARLRLAQTDVLAVGDGANDLGMLELAGTGVALHAKPAVAAKCTIRINHGDLTALLYLQGFARADFVAGDLASD